MEATLSPLETLTAVLCDPDGKCCIVGSDEDRRLVDGALASLAAAQSVPKGGAVSAIADALRMAIRQNSHDMLMTGEEIRQCEQALAASAPTVGALRHQIENAIASTGHSTHAPVDAAELADTIANALATQEPSAAAEPAAPRAIGEILLDAKGHPFARLRTGYDARGEQWAEGTLFYATPPTPPSAPAGAEWEKLRDPQLLHAALLRGLPAKLTREQFLHLAGDAPAGAGEGERPTCEHASRHTSPTVVCSTPSSPITTRCATCSSTAAPPSPNLRGAAMGDLSNLSRPALSAAMRGGTELWGKFGSASDHIRYAEPIKSRRRCTCGCGTRRTHAGMANGVCLTSGCEMSIYRWVKTGSRRAAAALGEKK